MIEALLFVIMGELVFIVTFLWLIESHLKNRRS
jgi:hypothetical protein